MTTAGCAPDPFRGARSRSGPHWVPGSPFPDRAWPIVCFSGAFSYAAGGAWKFAGPKTPVEHDQLLEHPPRQRSNSKFLNCRSCSIFQRLLAQVRPDELARRVIPCFRRIVNVTPSGPCPLETNPTAHRRPPSRPGLPTDLSCWRSFYKRSPLSGTIATCLAWTQCGESNTLKILGCDPRRKR